MFSKPLDFIAIGDTVVDAFIRLKEAHVTCKVNSEECELCMRFADKIPYESVTVVNAVGNSPNGAVSAARLGLSSALISDLGADQYGKDCLASLKKDGVNTKFITVHKNMVTNYHYVLWYDVDRTILVKHQDYPRTFPNIPEPKWIYLSSLGANSEGYHHELSAYLEKHPNVKLAFQPGTFQMKLGIEKLKTIYQHSDVFFCNVEEAQRILKIEETNKKILMAKLRELGPKIVVMTDGPNGAYTFDGTNAYFMPLYPDGKNAFERTGAGDAFASTLTCALVMGKPIEEALMWAPINSAFVVQKIGAQEGLLTQKELLEHLAKAPTDYKPTKI
jgi:ribokinase